MIVFNHIPRTGGTFLIEALQRSGFAAGPRVRFDRRRGITPELLLDREHRPVVLVYHVPGADFVQEFRRRPGDVVVTFLRDRVDMLYSNFAYMKVRIERGDRIPHWNAGQHRYFRRTLEEHVDSYLAEDTPDRQYPPHLGCYDFVGITEDMDRSLRALGRRLDITLSNHGVVNSVPTERTYRRAEVERRFAPQRELFAIARECLRAELDGAASMRVG